MNFYFIGKETDDESARIVQLHRIITNKKIDMWRLDETDFAIPINKLIKEQDAFFT